jgi:GNAT superfamily N-acetyltransferase
MVRKAADGQAAGFTAALPRRMLVDGRERICWNCADFSIRPEFRTLGIAIKLRRAAKEGVDAGRVDFLYAHPNARMQLIHDKVGHQPVGTMLRYVKPLKAAEYLRRKMGGKVLPAVVGPIADAALSLSSYERRHKPITATRFVECPTFDLAFDRLFADAAPQRRFVGRRDATYLNWRYADNPLYRTHALLAESAGRLAGYLLFTVDDATAVVKDCFTADWAGVAGDLLAALVAHARRIGLTSVSTILLAGHPAEDALRLFGFRRREDTSQMYGYAPAGSPLAESVCNPAAWLLAVGDRDV